MELENALKKALKKGHTIGEEHERTEHHIAIRFCTRDGCQASLLRDTATDQIAGSALTHVCKNWRMPDKNDPALKGMEMKDKHRSVHRENKLKFEAEEAAEANAEEPTETAGDLSVQ